MTALVSAGKALLTRGRVFAWEHAHTPAPPGGLRVLFYHRIATADDPLALPPQRFRAQMTYLESEGYHVVDVVTALNDLYAGTLLPKTVALTFDDGFKDMYDAVDILSDLGFSGTVFVSTAVIDGTAPYRWQHTNATVLNWTEVREFEASQILKFEAHSLTHRDLTRLPADECFAEIRDSRTALEQQIGRESLGFSYPFGFLGTREKQFVEQAGFRYGLSCEPGLNTISTDPYFVRRIQIDRTDRLRDFVAKVNGSHDLPLVARSVYRRLRYGVKQLPTDSSLEPAQPDSLSRRRGERDGRADLDQIA